MCSGVLVCSGISMNRLNTERNVHFAKGTFLSRKEDQLHSSPGADEYYQTSETFEIFLNVLESTDPFPVFTLSYATYSSRMKLGIARVSSKHPMLWFCQNKRIIKGRNSQKTCLKNVGNAYRTNTPIVLQKSQICRFLPFSHVCQ